MQSEIQELEIITKMANKREDMDNNIDTLTTRFVKSSATLSQIKKWSWLIAIVSFLIQITFFRNTDNLICSFNTLVIWYFATNYLLNPKRVINYPISIFLILSFTLTQFYFPLIFTTLEFKSLINNLKYPLDVFLHSDIAFFILITTHMLYRSWLSSFKTKVQSKIKIFQIYTIPNQSEIWIMGYLGLIASFFGRFNVGNGGILQKILEGSMLLAYIPYLIPFSTLFASKEKVNNRYYIKIIIYSIFIVLISIGANTRGGVILGLIAIALVYGLGIILGVFNYRVLSKKNILIIAVATYLFIGPLADLGTAMLIVRAQRKEISKEELVSQTFSYFINKAEINKHNISIRTKLGVGEWDENYLDNIFLSRFCNLKFNDLSLEQAHLIGNSNHSYYEFSIGKMLGTLPEPVLNFFQIDINKSNLNKNSFGDILYNLGGADQGQLEGMRGGHFAGTGLVAFGWWYLLILGLTMMPTYLLYDVFVVTEWTKVNGNKQLNSYISICILVNILGVFQFLPSESVVTNVSFLVRGWIQMLFIYSLFFFIAKSVSKIISF